MYKFSETIKYRDTLFKVIFNSELKLYNDFERSYNCVEDLVESLKKLDFKMMREEFIDKEVKKYLVDIDDRVDVDSITIEHKCENLFREDPKTIKDGMTNLVITFRDAAIKQHDAGNWTTEQLKYYRWMLTNFVYLTGERLRDFTDLFSDLFKENKKHGKTVLEFTKIFKEEHSGKIDNFKKWLNSEGFVSSDGPRDDYTNFARIYFLLQDENILARNSDIEGIRAFFKEFGVSVVEKLEEHSKEPQVTRRAVISDNAKDFRALKRDDNTGIYNYVLKKIQNIFR